jgi:hypothetical protein
VWKLSKFEQEVRPFITQEAGVLSGTLTEGMATAMGQARADSRRYPHKKFPHAMPMLLRCGMRMELEKQPLPAGWKLAGDSRLMGQLMLSHPELAIDLRFLKERRRTYSGSVPAAGRNPARRRAWSGDIAFPFEVESTEPERTTILWVWDFVGEPHDEDTGFTQRLVHTIAPGTYGRAVPCDLSLDLLPGGGIFDRLEFAGGEDSTDFFHVQLDETVEDGD